MSRPRRTYKAAEHQPAPRRSFYCHQPEKKPVSRTIARTENPWHDGIEEAKRSGARHSRGECLFAAEHSTERYADVCTDRRMREKERAVQKESDRKKVMYRKWGLVIS